MSFGNEFYEISSEFDESRASDWVKENVISKLGDKTRISKSEIAKKFLDFVGEEEVDLFGYYSDYDHVLLMWLYGEMIEKPKQLPFFTIDLRQDRLYRKNPTLLPQDKNNEHNALEDAKWNLKYFNHLNKCSLK